MAEHGTKESVNTKELPFKPITEEELHSNRDIAYYVQLPEKDSTELKDLANILRGRGFIARAVNTPTGRIVRILSDDVEMLKQLLPSEHFILMRQDRYDTGVYYRLDNNEKVKF